MDDDGPAACLGGEQAIDDPLLVGRSDGARRMQGDIVETREIQVVQRGDQGCELGLAQGRELDNRQAMAADDLQTAAKITKSQSSRRKANRPHQNTP